MADRDPGKVTAVGQGRLARGRPPGPHQPRNGPARGRRARPGQEGPLPILRARPRHGAGAARACSSRRATRPAAIIARGHCCSRSAFRWPMRSARGMGLAGGYSDGRDIGVVFNFPNPDGAHALPMCGGVGAQYTPAAGWAQAIKYKTEVLGKGPRRCDCGRARRRRQLRHRRILVRTNNCDHATIASAILHRGQWLRHLGHQRLPDPGPRHCRQPRELHRADHLQRRRHRSRGSGAAGRSERWRMFAAKRAPVLLRVTVPRLEGHSFQDTQTYKSEEEIAAEWARDPLPNSRPSPPSFRSATISGPRSSAKPSGRSKPRAPRPKAAESRRPSGSRPTFSTTANQARSAAGPGCRLAGRASPRAKASGSTWSPRSAA